MRVDVIVFSFDRALQLYAYLESQEKYLTGVNDTHVVYRASSPEHENSYTQVSQRFPKVQFHKQSMTPQNDFKQLVWSSVYSNLSPCSYIMFAVDDLIVKDHVNLVGCTNALEAQKAWGFFLRLGKNINFCYMLNQATPPPACTDVGGGIFAWKFADGQGDWGYPNNVDMTIYRKKDIMAYLRNENYIHPNSLEANWQKWRDMKGKGLCFQTSKNINIPLNLVNPSTNRCNNSFTVPQLLLKFQQGQKINIQAFHQINNTSPHVDYMPTFIPR